MGQGESKYNPISQEIERETPSVDVRPEYMPIELFLYNMSDNNKVVWIMDNIGILRSMFKVRQLNPEKDTKLSFMKQTYVFHKKDNKWLLNSSLDVVGENRKDDISLFHFNDGTAAMINKNQLYYLHFEECPDDLFEEMKKERKLRDRKAINNKISQKEFESQDEDSVPNTPSVEELTSEVEKLVINEEQEEKLNAKAKPFKPSGYLSKIVHREETGVRQRKSYKEMVTSKK